MNSKLYSSNNIKFNVICIQDLSDRLTSNKIYDVYEMTKINEDIMDGGIVYYKVRDDKGRIDWYSKRNLVFIYNV